MNEAKFKELLNDYVLGRLNAQDEQACEQFLEANPNYNDEVNSFRKVVLGLHDMEIPEPSENMDANFYAFLNSKTAQSKNNHLKKWWSNIWEIPFAKQLAFGVVILGFGMFLGNLFFGSMNAINSDGNTKIVSKQDAKNSQNILVLLEETSASKRLEAVNKSAKLNRVNDRIIAALFMTLNNDENVNVRLAAIESLALFTDNAKVRQGLIASITRQESPMVQIALADLMILLQEKKSVKEFKILLKAKDINEFAKDKLEKTIQYLM